MITREELETLVKQNEADRVEKTISLTDTAKYGEAICSFANDLPNHNKPGYLIIGITDDGNRNGTQISDAFLQILMDFRTDGRINPPPAMSVAKFEFPDGDVAVVEVQPHYLPPVRFKGKVCVRIGPRKGVANEAEERILSEKRSSFAKTFDTLPCMESKIDDLSIDIFKTIYLSAAVDQETLDANHCSSVDQLISLKFFDIKAQCPTNAGILMFGKNPRFYLPGSYIQYVRFKGMDEVSDFEYEQRFEGDLTTQLRVLNDFVKSQIIKRVQHRLGDAYEQNFPENALQELLFNAIIHRDYQSNAPIKFYEFQDRIEITNPGGLYGDVRPENFPNQNDYRNPVLAEAAKNLGFINRFNVGVKRAMNAMKNNGNPDLTFILDQTTSFGVIIPKKTI